MIGVTGRREGMNGSDLALCVGGARRMVQLDMLAKSLVPATLRAYSFSQHGCQLTTDRHSEEVDVGYGVGGDYGYLLS